MCGVGSTHSRMFGVDLNTFDDWLLRSVGYILQRQSCGGFLCPSPRSSCSLVILCFGICSWTGKVNGYPFCVVVQDDFYYSLLLSEGCLVSPNKLVSLPINIAICIYIHTHTQTHVFLMVECGTTSVPRLASVLSSVVLHGYIMSECRSLGFGHCL